MEQINRPKGAIGRRPSLRTDWRLQGLQPQEIPRVRTLGSPHFRRLKVPRS
jgi:hypothetical protein